MIVKMLRRACKRRLLYKKISTSANTGISADAKSNPHKPFSGIAGSSVTVVSVIPKAVSCHARTTSVPSGVTNCTTGTKHNVMPNATTKSK